MPTNIQEAIHEFWTSDKSSPERMWDSWEDPHRKQILTALSCLPPFTSLYELGAGCGPNLRLIHYYRRQTKLAGFDTNPGHVAFARERGLEITHGDFPQAPGEEWDVALSCYALAYVEPEIAKDTIAAIGSKALVLFEPTALIEPFAQPGLYQLGVPTFAHDYLSMLRDTGWRIHWRWPLYPHHQGLNVIVVAER